MGVIPVLLLQDLVIRVILAMTVLLLGSVESVQRLKCKLV